MSNLLAKLREAVAREPGNLSYRQQYANLVADSDPGFAAFVRHQLRGAKMLHDEKEDSDLVQSWGRKNIELLEACGGSDALMKRHFPELKELLGTMASEGGINMVGFTGGFPEMVAVPGDEWLRHADRLLELAPLELVYLTYPPDFEKEELTQRCGCSGNITWRAKARPSCQLSMAPRHASSMLSFQFSRLIISSPDLALKATELIMKFGADAASLLAAMESNPELQPLHTKLLSNFYWEVVSRALVQHWPQLEFRRGGISEIIKKNGPAPEMPAPLFHKKVGEA